MILNVYLPIGRSQHLDILKEIQSVLPQAVYKKYKIFPLNAQEFENKYHKIYYTLSICLHLRKHDFTWN